MSVKRDYVQKRLIELHQAIPRPKPVKQVRCSAQQLTRIDAAVKKARRLLNHGFTIQGAVVASAGYYAMSSVAHMELIESRLRGKGRALVVVHRNRPDQ